MCCEYDFETCKQIPYPVNKRELRTIRHLCQTRFKTTTYSTDTFAKLTNGLSVITSTKNMEEKGIYLTRVIITMFSLASVTTLEGVNDSYTTFSTLLTNFGILETLGYNLDSEADEQLFQETIARILFICLNEIKSIGYDPYDFVIKQITRAKAKKRR